MNAKIFAKRALKKLKKASPTILAIASGVGVVATAVLSARSTLKAMPTITSYENKEHIPEKTVSAVKEVVKCYSPTVAVGAATICSIAGAHILNKRQQKALTSAYLALGTAFSQYKSQARELYGDDADEKIQAAVEQKKEETEDDDKLYTFTDEWKNEPFEKTWSDVLATFYNLNLQLQQEGYVSVNDIYRQLELPEMSGGDAVGWSWEMLGDMFDICWLPFQQTKITTDDGMEIWMISVPCDPSPKYMED